MRRRESNSYDDLERSVSDLNGELAKMGDFVKKSGESFAKFGAGLESFLLSPITGNLQQVLSNVQSLATKSFGGIAQDAAGLLLGEGGSDTAARWRKIARSATALNDTEAELEGLGEQFGRMGISLDRGTVDALLPVLRRRNELGQSNQAVVHDAFRDVITHDIERSPEALVARHTAPGRAIDSINSARAFATIAREILNASGIWTTH